MKAKFKAAVASGDWVVVKDLVCSEHVDVTDIERSRLLHKLAYNSKINFSLVEDIVDKICLRHIDVNLSDDSRDAAVMAAARCGNWKALRLLMSRKAVLPDDEEWVIGFLQMMSRSEDLRQCYVLSADILGYVWTSLKQTKPDHNQIVVHNVLGHVAAKLGCWWLVRDLFGTDFDLNTLDEDGWGVVHRLGLGRRNEHVSFLQLVLDQGANIDLQNVDGDTIAHIAAKNSNWEMLEAVLLMGGDSGVVNKEKKSILHILVASFPSDGQLCKNFDVIFTMLQKGCLHIDLRDGGGNTALHLAVKAGQSLVAEKLLNSGARVDAQDEKGRTVLHTLALQEHKYSSSLLQKAVERTAGLETKDTEGNTALHLAGKLENWGYVRELITHGAVIIEPDSEGYTIFDRMLSSEEWPSCLDSSQQERSGVFRVLAADVQLCRAVKCKRWADVKERVGNGANINKPDMKGFTVIQRLAQLECDKSMKNIFSFILKRRADIAVRTPEGDNLLQLAARHKNWLIVEHLLRAGRFSVHEPDSEGVCVLHRLAEYRRRDPAFVFDLLRGKGVRSDTSQRNPSGDTLLQLAAKSKNIPMVKYLVRKASSGAINELDSHGFSLLHRIAQCRCNSPNNVQGEKPYLISVFDLLLNRGARAYLRTRAGDTVLHLAAKHSNWQLFERLAKKRFNINEPDSEGFYALHRLAQTKQEHLRTLTRESNKAKVDGLFRLFLKKGADLSVRSSSGDTVLHAAAKEGNWMLVNYLLQQGVEINELDSEGFNILHRLVKDSATQDHISQLEILVGRGANLNCICPHEGTALHMAVKNRKWKFAKRLVEVGADVNLCDHDGITALHVIAFQDLEDDDSEVTSLVHHLFEKGADLNAQSPQGDSFFLLASRNPKWREIMEQMTVQRTSEINADETDKKRPTVHNRVVSRENDLCLNSSVPGNLFLEASSGKNQTHCSQRDGMRCRLTCFDDATKHRSGNAVSHLCAKDRNVNQVRKILSCGLEPQLTNGENHTELPWLDAENGVMVDKYGNVFKVCKGLKTIALCLRKRDEFGDTWLQVAARSKNVDVVRMLLDHVDDINMTDINGLTVLHRIVQWESSVSFRIVKTLLKKKANVEILCPKGNTSLHLAAQCGNWVCVQELLENGAQYDSTDSEGLTVLHRAVKWKSSSSLCIVKTLLKKKANVEILCPKGNTSLHLAAQCGNWVCVQELLENGAQCDSTDSEGLTVLHRAVKSDSSGVFRIVKFLMTKKANMESLCPKGNTSLHLAAQCGNWVCVQELLENGAQCDSTDSEGLTVLHRAVKSDSSGAFHIVKLLMMKRANMEVFCPKGNTALHLAAQYGKWNIVRELLVNGAKTTNNDNKGMSILHILVRQNRNFNNPSGQTLQSLLMLLVTYGLQVNQTGPDGKTPLQVALQEEKWKFLWWLVELGAHFISFSLEENERILGNIHHFPEKNIHQDKLKAFVFHLTAKNSPVSSVSSKSHRKLALCAKEAVVKCVSHSKYVVARILVECGADISKEFYDEPFLHFVVSRYERNSHVTWLSFLDALLARGVDINSRDKAGRTVLFRNWRKFSFDCDQYTPNSLLRVLLDRGANPLIPDFEGTSLLRVTMDLEKSLALRCLRFLIELGVSTHQPALTETIVISSHYLPHAGYFQTSTRSPTQTAFEKRYVAAFKIMVESGASSNKELFQFSGRCQGEFAFKDRTRTEAQMLDILHQAESMPRSLQSMCRLLISHSVGCASPRRERVKSLPLPPALQEYILFCDILSTEFLDSVEEEDKKLDRLRGIVRSNFLHDMSNDFIVLPSQSWLEVREYLYPRLQAVRVVSLCTPFRYLSTLFTSFEDNNDVACTDTPVIRGVLAVQDPTPKNNHKNYFNAKKESKNSFKRMNMNSRRRGRPRLMLRR